jgi:hypothetical protein
MNSTLTVFFKYIQDYYNSTFKLAYFLIVSAMLSVILFLNYVHPSLIDLVNEHAWPLRFGWFYFLYLIPFAAAYLLQAFYFGKKDFLKNKYFITLLLLAPAYFSFRVNFNFHHPLVNMLWCGDEAIFWQRCCDWIVRAVVLISLVYLTWLFTKQKGEPVYGLVKNSAASPYLLVLMWMIPLIAIAAIQPDFMHMYPRAQMVAPLSLPNKGLHYYYFELSYAFDILSIEFFFRGFLIIAFMRYCGTQCIIPAACFYCCIHLGKPMGEAISSFAGGLFLGIVAYYTRSIKGALILHLGIAAMMELAGFAAHAYLK